MDDSESGPARSSCVYRLSMGRPESVRKCSLRSAGDLVFVSDILEPIFLAHCEQKTGTALGSSLPSRGQRAEACRAPRRIDYNLRARRNELSAKKKNTRAKATATAEATSQWSTSRVQERSAALSRTIPRNANMAPATSRESC